MTGLNRFKWPLPALLLLSAICQAENKLLVEHYDPIQVDPDLSLSGLIEQTLHKYPDTAIIPALKQEAEALQRRGNSWLAEAPNIVLYYQDDAPGSDFGARELEGAIELPLWNWGQREAGLNVADQALQISDLQKKFIRLVVAGLVRSSLWDLTLEDSRYRMALKIHKVTEQLLNTVKRRVDLGDLPKADYLLANSEHLRTRSELVSAEAELMHARKRFASLTQNKTIPGDFQEQKSTQEKIHQSHPALQIVNAEIARKKAELDWVKSAGSGQTVFSIGGKTERGSRQDDDIESMTFELSVPFGGSAHLAPEIATANLELTEVLNKRDHLHRQLNQDLHEAEHALEVGRAELAIANELQEIAEAHLKITQLSFKAGEINLMDLLKIQSRTHAAIRHANEQTIILHRNTAAYNQVVGVQP